MIVRKIIEGKPTHQIITIKPAESVRAAAELLAKHRIGAVLVSTDGKGLDGILSERDIVRALGTTGAGCLDLSTAELMTENVIGCAPDDSANSILEKMTEGRFRHMPVFENDAIVGVISIGDVVKARISEIQSENEALTGMIANTWICSGLVIEKARRLPALARPQLAVDSRAALRSVGRQC